MSKFIALGAIIGVTAIAGCTQNIRPTDTDRAILGAAGAATIAKVAGKEESTIYKAAAAGGAAGALCNDVGFCQ